MMRMVAWWHGGMAHGRDGDAQAINEKPYPGTNKAWPSLPKDPTSLWAAIRRVSCVVWLVGKKLLFIFDKVFYFSTIYA
jgi:hypothetical protein